MITEVDYEVDNVKDFQSWEGVLETSAKWCFPDFGSLRSSMRSVYDDVSNANQQAKSLKAHLIKTHNNKNINKKYKDIITNILKEK